MLACIVSSFKSSAAPSLPSCLRSLAHGILPLPLPIQGPKGTVYEGGLFKLSVDIPAR